AAAEAFDVQRAGLQVRPVDVGDLELAARRRPESGGDTGDLVVVEVETSHRPRRPWLRRLFLEAHGTAVAIELDDAIAPGTAPPVGEDGTTGGSPHGSAQVIGQAVAVEDVVAEGERDRVPADELAADQKRLGQAVRAGLYGVIDVD